MCRAPEREGMMSNHPLDPQLAYEVLAEALQTCQAQGMALTDQGLTALREAIACAMEVWQQCEPLRATREKEFRYHVVKLKMLLAGAAVEVATTKTGRSTPCKRDGSENGNTLSPTRRFTAPLLSHLLRCPHTSVM